MINYMKTSLNVAACLLLPLMSVLSFRHIALASSSLNYGVALYIGLDGLHSSNTDGTNDKLLVSKTTVPSITNPMVSADGKTIYFQSIVGNGSSSDGEMYKANVDGTGVTDLHYSTSGLRAALSPDGTKVAYLVGGTWFGGKAIRIRNVDGSGTIKDIHQSIPGDIDNPTWATNSKLVYRFNTNSSNDCYNFLSSLNSDGSGFTYLTPDHTLNTPNTCATPRFPSVNFVTGEVAYELLNSHIGTNGSIDLYGVNLDSTNNQLIYSPPDRIDSAGTTYGQIARPHWSPDGNYIAIGNFDPTTGIRDTVLLDSNGAILTTLAVPADFTWLSSTSPQTDITSPTITPLISPVSNADGWNNTDVTVSFNCSDDTAIASCSSPIALTNEGANQTVTGTAVDKAGNTANTTATINIDKTAPTINYLVTPAPNINGWNQDNVTVSFLCSDNLSGIDTCSAPVTLSADGANQTITGTAVDKAGNTATVTAIISLDKTAPTINYSASPTANSNGWNNSDVLISFTCDDGLSGIDSCSSPETISTEGANQTVTGTATDKAGNSSAVTATVNIDKSAPIITASVSPAPNSDGWTNSDVTVSFTCSDSLSGIDVCPSPITLSEGAGQIITGTATDKAGNSASTSVMVNVDKTAPVVSNLSWLANPLQQGQNTTLMATVTDGLSGVKSLSYAVNGGAPQPMTYDPISGNWIVTFGASLPANTYNITVIATDMADNSSLGTNDVLAVYTTANGYVNGHAKTLPTSTDVLPIAQDTSKNPADLVMGFTNVTAPMSGSFDLDYAVKNKQDEFSLSSTSISWVVVSDSTHASILGHADLTTYVNGVKTVTTNTTVRYDITLGTNGSADHVSVKIYNPGVDPNTGTPAYTIGDDVEANGSNLMIHP